MSIISVINYKGGVGKTTVTANLAAELAFRGKRVLIVDTDAQASLTFSFFQPDYWDSSLKDKYTIKTWFDAIAEGKDGPSLLPLVRKPVDVGQYIDRSRKDGSLEIIPSHLGLINVDLELATLLGGANMTQTKKNYIRVHGQLRNALTALKEDQKYDYILIDCPPNFNIVTKNAIIASDGILVPAKPDYLSTLGIDYLHRSVRQLVKEFNEYASHDTGDRVTTISPEIIGVLFTMIQVTSGNPIAAQRQFIAQAVRQGVAVFDEWFRENKTIFADAPQGLVPVVLHRYSGQTYANVVSEIEKVVTEFERRTAEVLL